MKRIITIMFVLVASGPHGMISCRDVEINDCFKAANQFLEVLCKDYDGTSLQNAGNGTLIYTCTKSVKGDV